MPPFSGRSLLVPPDDGAVDHQVLVVAALDQVGKILVSYALGRPEREAFINTVALRDKKTRALYGPIDVTVVPSSPGDCCAKVALLALGLAALGRGHR